MTFKKGSLIGLVVISIILVLGIIYIFPRLNSTIIKNTTQPKAGFIEGYSDTITILPTSGNATSVIMDFSKCSRGSSSVSFAFGSTHFAFEGIKNNECVFYYGGEIENPKWDRTLPFKCAVPTNLRQKTFEVGNYGIQMTELNEFCIKAFE